MPFDLAPKTKRLLEYFEQTDPGELRTYAEILLATECDVAGADRSRIYTVIRRLEASDSRTLFTVRGRGYKVAEAREHVGLMEERKRRADHHVQMGLRTGRAADIAVLDDAERVELSNIVGHFSHVSQILRNHERQIARHDAQIRAIQTHVGMEDLPADPVDGTAEEQEAA